MKQHHNKETVGKKQPVIDWSDDIQEPLPFDTHQSNCQGQEDMSCDYEESCVYNCTAIDDFLDLTDEMIETIISLEDELVRWRQALVKYLPKEWAEGLRQDIFNNLSRDYEGEPAYDLYIKLRRGLDPQQEGKRISRLYRLANGTDDTSIDYL